MKLTLALRVSVPLCFYAWRTLTGCVEQDYHLNLDVIMHAPRKRLRAGIPAKFVWSFSAWETDRVGLICCGISLPRGARAVLAAAHPSLKMCSSDSRSPRKQTDLRHLLGGSACAPKLRCNYTAHLLKPSCFFVAVCYVLTAAVCS